MYKIETHLHTTYTSRCGHMEAEALIAGYKAAGYSGICVTDHYNRTTFDYLGIDLTKPGDKLNPFMEGFYRLREEGAKHGITVYRGAELRFDESDNDYLFYGFSNDMLEDPEAVFRMGIAAYSAEVRSRGALIIQAHPYRKGCTPAIARYLDGVEVFNGNPRHNSKNDRAQEYAAEFGLIGTSGSDCHQPTDVAIGGILSETLPSNDFNMMRLIRSRNFKLIGC